MFNFVVHSNDSVCRKSGRLGLEQVISRFLFVMWIVGVVMSLNVVLFCSSVDLLGLCDVSISSAGNSLVGGESVLSFRVGRVEMILVVVEGGRFVLLPLCLCL